MPFIRPTILPSVPFTRLNGMHKISPRKAVRYERRDDRSLALDGQAGSGLAKLQTADNQRGFGQAESSNGRSKPHHKPEHLRRSTQVNFLTFPPCTRPILDVSCLIEWVFNQRFRGRDNSSAPSCTGKGCKWGRPHPSYFCGG